MLQKSKHIHTVHYSAERGTESHESLSEQLNIDKKKSYIKGLGFIMLDPETTQWRTLDLWKPMGTRERIPASPLYISGHPRLRERTLEKPSNNWEVILQQCPSATGTSIKHWLSQENTTCLHHGRTCSSAGSSSIIPHAILNTSENFGKIHYWCICHCCYAALK